MITKMKKLTFLIYHKEYERFLKAIQELGVLHIETRQEGRIETPELTAKMQRVEHLRDLISKYADLEITTSTSCNAERGDKVLTRIDELNELLHQNEHTLQRYKKDETVLAPWGDFDPRSIKRLKEAGHKIKFFTCPERFFQEDWTEQYNATLIHKEGDRLYFITITPVDKEIDINAEAVILPDLSLGKLKADIKAEQDHCEKLEKEITETITAHIGDLRELEASLRTSIEFDSVILGTGHTAENRVMILQGWIPEDKEGMVKSFLDKEDVCYDIRLATKKDNAPIKLRNNSFTRMYEVLTQMYGMPDYGEFDPTPLVAPFFTLFFAFCMGDAGYGLILIALGFYLKHKMSKSLAGMMNLVITLGIATTVIGAILGTFFGVSLFDIDLPEWMKQFMIVGKVGETSYDKQMLLALLIGVVHICIAITVKAISSTVRFGFRESISTWGWLFLIIGFVCTGGLSFFKIISEDVSTWAFIIIGSISAIGIYLLNDLHRNVFINIGAGLWDTYNMATGLLGDVLSYIRLYALGLAGGMLGGVFNQLAFMVEDSTGGIPGIIFCGLILVFGHALNIAMSCLSAFVHPLRLTFVEYFKNSGYEGKGEAYKPFSVIENK